MADELQTVRGKFVDGWSASGTPQPWVRWVCPWCGESLLTPCGYQQCACGRAYIVEIDTENDADEMNQTINTANRVRELLERNARKLHRDGEINDAELQDKLSGIEAEYEMYLDREGME